MTSPGTSKDLYDALDESWPGDLMDYLRAAVEGGETNHQIFARLEFLQPPPAKFFVYLNAVLDYMREQA